jgi:hypothetical protein
VAEEGRERLGEVGRFAKWGLEKRGLERVAVVVVAVVVVEMRRGLSPRTKKRKKRKAVVVVMVSEAVVNGGISRAKQFIWRMRSKFFHRFKKIFT